MGFPNPRDEVGNLMGHEMVDLDGNSFAAGRSHLFRRFLDCLRAIVL